MKNLLLVIVSLTFLISSCAEKQSSKSNLEAGMAALSGFFGGTSDYSVGSTKNANGVTEKYVELTLSSSNILYEIPTDLALANMAYLFYNNLGEDKANYAYIKSIVTLANGNEKERNFSTVQLEKVVQQMPQLINTLETIRAGDYEKIKAKLSTDLVNIDKDRFIKTMQVAEENLGEISEVTPCGFRITKLENGFELLQLAAIVIREYQNSKFSIEIDLNGQTDNLYRLNYQY